MLFQARDRRQDGGRGRDVRRGWIMGLAVVAAFHYVVSNAGCGDIEPSMMQPGTDAHDLDEDDTTAEDLMYKYMSDKSRDDHGYTKLYDMIFGPIRHQVTNVTEVGISAGQSIQAWFRYFPNAEIHGIDIFWQSEFVETNLKRLGPRFHGHIVDLLKGSSPASVGLHPETMDVIIEDGPHWSGPQITFLIKLFPLVKPGGYYIIEDISQKMGGVKAFHEQPNEKLPPAAREILESNDAIWIDTSAGHRAWDEWAKRSPREVQNRTHHNSYCLVIKKRDRPLRPLQMNRGQGAMDPNSVIKEDIFAEEVDERLASASI